MHLTFKKSLQESTVIFIKSHQLTAVRDVQLHAQADGAKSGFLPRFSNHRVWPLSHTARVDKTQVMCVSPRQTERIAILQLSKDLDF